MSGPMRLDRVVPASLPGFVVAFWQQRAVHADRWRILPSGNVELIFRLGGAFALRRARVLTAEALQVRQPSFLSGLHTGPLDLTWEGLTAFGVTLHPVAVRVLFGLPCDAVRDGAVAGLDLWDDLARLEDRLTEAPSFGQRVRIAEAELRARLSRAAEVTFAERLRAFLESLPVGAGVGAVEARFGYSRSHTHRLFREWLGGSVGDHLRLRRFVSACQLLCRPDLPLAGLATQLGFHDQAHFTRDFRRHADLSPGNYRALGPVIPGQLSVDGTSVQDAK